MTSRDLHRIVRIVLLSICGISIISFSVWWVLYRGTINPNDPIQVARGSRLYAIHCAQCHGAKLEGEAEWQTRRPSGELPAPPHDASGHTWHHPDEQLFAITKHGLAKFAPADYRTAMPAFIGVLKDGEIRDVLAFIKSTWPNDLRARQEGLNR